MTISTHQNTGRAAALKAATRAAHETLDARMMAAGPFRDAGRYATYLKLQRRFFALVHPLYREPALKEAFEGLENLSRLAATDADLATLGVAPETHAEALSVPAPQALGWLYVAEGSRLGGAFLAVEAEKLGFGPTSGARHLADSEEGRGRAWNAFRRQLDAIPLTPEEEGEAVAGAVAAFDFMLAATDEAFGPLPESA